MHLLLSHMIIFIFLRNTLQTVAFSLFIHRNQRFSLHRNLKLVSAIFINFLLFHQMIALQKLWKVFLISLKKLFSFLRYSNFCKFVLSFPHFSDAKRQNGPGIIYDAMNWLALICKCDFWNNSTTALYYIIKLGQIIYN